MAFQSLVAMFPSPPWRLPLLCPLDTLWAKDQGEGNALYLQSSYSVDGLATLTGPQESLGDPRKATRRLYSLNKSTE